MRKETNPQENSSSGLTPSVPWRIRSITVLNDYCIAVQFMDGLTGLVDLSSLMLEEDPGVFKALRDVHVFKKAYINRGAITWPGSLDLAPDAMYEAIKKTGKYIL